MVSARKRGRQEMEDVEPPREPSLLERIRNMWQFANLAQWIFIFGKVVKIDENLDIEELEMECLRPHSTVLAEIGLALLKFVSSHRGLTPEIFEEYTRRQYLAKAPQRNPFGDAEEPIKFNDLDIFTRIRVLQQLTQWTMTNPDRIRERMEEQKDFEQTFWRIEPFGWDSEDRTYIVLDDNRLYRRTDPPPPPPPAVKPKKNSKKAKAALRASKRRRVSEAQDSEPEPAEEEEAAEAVKEDDGLGGMKWECLAVTLEEVNDFVRSTQKSRDANEKILRQRLTDDLLPLLEKQEEARKRKAAQKERELLNLEKLATAKRSSRIAGKLEHQRQEEEEKEAHRKKEAELVMARKEQERWSKLEKERESRMMTREQRVKEREVRRILHEEELASLSEDSKKLETGQGRLSERHLKAEIERKKQVLEELAVEEDWIFDCICGAYGQIDDGTHSIACEKCSIWQHSKCVGVSQAEADREDFHFVCKTCKRHAREVEEAKKHPPIKIKFNTGGASAAAKQNESPPTSTRPLSDSTPNAQGSPQKGTHSLSTLAQASSVNSLQSSPWHHSFPPPKSSILYGGLGATQASNSQSHQTQSSPRKPTVIEYMAAQSGQSGNSGPLHSNLAAGSERQPPFMNGTPSLPTPKSPDVSLSGPNHDNGSPALAPQHNVTHSGAHASFPPHHLSPISQPAPKTSLAYNPITAHTPYTNNASIGGQPEATQQVAQPPSSYAEGNDTSHRRSSISLPSPLGTTPVLKPHHRPDQTLHFLTSSSPLIASTPYTRVTQQHSSHLSSSPLAQTPSLPSPHSHAHPLPPIPPSTSGFSPTKHTSPLPSITNGSFGSATPSVLPPVASLSPSPRLLNLAPPVKPTPSDPERYRQSAQNLGQ